ncbi:MAG: Electron transport complex protein RnfE [Thermocaproicibacter melissae]|jgi:Na+-translocating ferredoxin:NAD+ oxidoreductase RnfE subunit|uniref:Rnf-Nqr domain containing protein n=1 Tax=Thermocaproicibacter melissae TaxID=2966552 RepID=UPI0024B1AC08|nr:Rnf-Nqr domain containing protein [Thermocaproicibacter melissae]WBY64394.1 Rnf-Nqr domain containing protein [Thermocaproicibacter melissae]
MNNRLSSLHNTGVIFKSGLLFRNPVLVGALGLFPIVSAATGLKNGVALSVLFLMISVPSELLFCAIGLLIPKWIRPAAILLVSAVFYIPAFWVLQQWMPSTANNLGLAAALMTCNSILYSRTEEYAPEHIFPAVLADAFGCSFGFAAVVCLVGSVRELWLTRDLWGHGSFYDGIGSGLNLPFAGFLFLGLLSAVVQKINLRRENVGA